MGVDVLSINLDDPNRQYSPGQAVAGKVLLSVSDQETTTEVLIRFFGHAHTHWEETETRQRYHRNDSIGHSRMHSGSSRHSIGGHYSTEYIHIHYEANESLFDFALRLYGDGVNKYLLPVGDNVFPFTFQVPARPLPVTCSFEDGYVQYGLEARVRKPWYQFDPKTDVLPVTIYTMVDLNITPGAANPMQVQDNRAYGCCCPSEPCYVQSVTPKIGYIPGEVIPCTVDIRNMSDRPILNLTATLTQMWTLFADSYQRGRHSRTKPIALQGAGHPGIAPGQGATWQLSFTVPATVPPTPNPAACSIVTMEYVIVISVAVDGCCCSNANDFGISHPIIVGTIPLAPPVVVQAQTPKYDELGGLA